MPDFWTPHNVSQTIHNRHFAQFFKGPKIGQKITCKNAIFRHPIPDHELLISDYEQLLHVQVLPDYKLFLPIQLRLDYIVQSITYEPLQPIQLLSDYKSFLSLQLRFDYKQISPLPELKFLQTYDRIEMRLSAVDLNHLKFDQAIAQKDKLVQLENNGRILVSQKGELVQPINVHSNDPHFLLRIIDNQAKLIERYKKKIEILEEKILKLEFIINDSNKKKQDNCYLKFQNFL